MTSPLVRRLLANIDQSDNFESRACHVAELACYWARVGEFDQAENLRSELRKSFSDGHNVRVSILIMCLEALLAYFRELSPQARDRMARASLLSIAANDQKLVALTSAWMAHIDFNLNRFDSMASAATTCLSSIASDDGTAECRVSLVLGDAFLFAGSAVSSDSWYRRARSAAERTGDQAAIGALTYNRAALHVAAARIRQLDQELPAPDAELVWAEVKSAINYQATAHLKSLEHLLKTAHVGALILKDRFSEALPIIDEIFNVIDASNTSAQRTALRADRALSLAMSGKAVDAMKEIDALQQVCFDSFAPDDRALMFSSIRETCKVCNRMDESKCYDLPIQSAMIEHKHLMNRLRSSLQQFDVSLHK